MNPREILELTMTETAAAIARGELTSVQATQASLAQARALGPSLNCIAGLEAEAALEKAEAADRARTAGRAAGALHGVPLAHKDIFYRRGKVVAGGSKVRRDFVAPSTATVLQRLEAAGSIFIGALHMAEFALSPTGYNEHYGHARNPWNPEHVPGGSSSGSGVAVAARIVSASLGTDTAGSIRHPAAMCGVTGLKPTLNRVSRAAVMPLSHSLDCVGPLARTARDCARLLGIIAGPDAGDPTTAHVPVPDYEAALDGNVRGLRIGVPRSYYYDLVDDGIRACLEESLRTLRELGAEPVEVDIPDMSLISALGHVLMSVEAATIHRRWLETRRAEYSDQVRSRIEAGLLYPATRYCEALRLRASLSKNFIDRALAGVDLLHLPAIPVPVPTIHDTVTGEPAEVARMIAVLGHCTRGINYLGLPAISVPAGFDAAGLPAAFQLVARPFGEASVLRVADAYQRATDWHKRSPVH